MFDVELRGLHGVCLYPGRDPELIPEANSDFVNRLRWPVSRVDATSLSGGHDSQSHTHLLSTSFGRCRAECWLSSLNASPAICSPDDTAEGFPSSQHQTVLAAWLHQRVQPPVVCAQLKEGMVRGDPLTRNSSLPFTPLVWAF